MTSRPGIPACAGMTGGLAWLTSFQPIPPSHALQNQKRGQPVASSASERTDGEAINQVARNCGSLAIECSDVAGYVAGVNERISANLKMLDSLEDVTTRLMADQARVSDSTDEARVLAEQARGKLEQGRAAIEDTIRIFSGLTDLVVQLGDRMAGFTEAMTRVQRVSSCDRDDRQQDQHARPQRHHRGGAGGRGGPLASRSSPPR